MRPGGAELTKRLLALCPLDKGAHVLDAGCGLGETVELLRLAGALAVGIDISQSLVDEGRRLYPEAERITADMYAAPFPEASFDALLMQCVLSETGTPPLRLLKKGGVLYISDIYDKEKPPAPPEGTELVAFEDASETLAEFAARLLWRGLPLPDCGGVPRSRAGYYIMAVKKL